MQHEVTLELIDKLISKFELTMEVLRKDGTTETESARINKLKHVNYLIKDLICDIISFYETTLISIYEKCIFIIDLINEMNITPDLLNAINNTLIEIIDNLKDERNKF